MDYIEEFRNLSTNQKYSRPSPHKPILLLTVISMFEKEILTTNKIIYNEELKRVFEEMWKRIIPHESLFVPGVYLPFWYLQSDKFWHIVPIRGKEDVLTVMRDRKIKPSETKLKESVDYAELDEDLYFLMTMASGRGSLKKTLLETYFTLSPEEIEVLCKESFSSKDNSAVAIAEYEQIIGKGISRSIPKVIEDAMAEDSFTSLNEDLQIEINLEYYKFLKEHPYERDLFRQICPTVASLYENITTKPVQQENISPSFSFSYCNFLRDLKIALMGMDLSSDIVDSITKAIDVLEDNTYSSEIEIEEPMIEYSESNENDTKEEYNSTYDSETIEEQEDKGPWSEHEIDILTLYHQNGRSIEQIADRLGRSVADTETQLANLGFINLPLDLTVHNTKYGGALCDKYGEVVYTDDAKLKIFHDSVYRFNLKSMCLTVKDIKRTDKGWVKGGKMLVAYSDSDLYPVLSHSNFINEIEDFAEGESREQNRIKVKGIWYDYYGDVVSTRSQQIRQEIKSPIYNEPSVPSRKRWSAAERRELQSYYESGMSIEKLASFFSTTKDNVIEVLKKLKIYR